MANWLCRLFGHQWTSDGHWVTMHDICPKCDELIGTYRSIIGYHCQRCQHVERGFPEEGVTYVAQYANRTNG